jgi:anti-sigma B factor antagonist
MTIEVTSIEIEAGVITVSILGDIDMGSSTKVRDHLVPLFKSNQKVVLVDLSEVNYIDSSGIATLVEGLQWSHSSKNIFRLMGLTSSVRDVFDIARLSTVFEIFESQEEALKGF